MASRVSTIISLDGLKLDLENCRVLSGAELLTLTMLQARLLHILMTEAPQTINRAALASYIWITDFTEDTTALNPHVRNLRKKLVNNPIWKIETVKGLGYRLTRISS